MNFVSITIPSAHRPTLGLTVTKSGRIDATLGLSCFSRTEAQSLIRTEVDYYEPTLGDKRDGKIISVTDEGYTILDCDTNDRHVFKFRV